MQTWNGYRFTAKGWALWYKTGGTTSEEPYKADILRRANRLAAGRPIGAKHILQAGQERHLAQMNPLEV